MNPPAYFAGEWRVGQIFLPGRLNLLRSNTHFHTLFPHKITSLVMSDCWHSIASHKFSLNHFKIVRYRSSSSTKNGVEASGHSVCILAPENRSHRNHSIRTGRVGRNFHEYGLDYFDDCITCPSTMCEVSHRQQV